MKSLVGVFRGLWVEMIDRKGASQTEAGKSESGTKDDKPTEKKSVEELEQTAAKEALELKFERDKLRAQLKTEKALNKLEDADVKRLAAAKSALAPLEAAKVALGTGYSANKSAAEDHLKTTKAALDAAEAAWNAAKQKLDDLVKGRAAAEKLEAQGSIQKDIDLIVLQRDAETELFKKEKDAVKAEGEAEMAKLQAEFDEESKKL